MASEHSHLLHSSSEESLLSPHISYGGMPTSPNHHATVQSGEDTLRLYGYRTTKARTVVFWTLSIITLGVFRLILHWYPKAYLFVRSPPCNLDEADTILVIDDHDVKTIRPVRQTTADTGEALVLPNERGDVMTEVDSFRWFTFHKMKYIWFEHECRFITPSDIDCTMKVSSLLSLFTEQGLSTAEAIRRRLTYGCNLIEVKVKPIWYLLFREAITPFYIFQVFSVIVWYTDQYAYYASVIVFMSISSIVTDVWQMRKQETKLRSMIHSVGEAEVIRDGVQLTVSSEELVVGDVVIIPRHGCTLQCDVVLVSGSVIVNESMLTGESVPITKTSLATLDDDNSSGDVRLALEERHSKHVLYCGTAVLQTRYYKGQPVTGIVIRTAYSTLKGELVRSIMYPKPVDFRFTNDLFKFVAFLACIALCGFAYTITIMVMRGNDISRIIIRSLDIVTIVVPPALPAAMSVGIINSKMRLAKKNIFCISPSTINTCGAINVVCFDKTGTLTEDGLDFLTMLAVRFSKKIMGVKWTGELQSMDPAHSPRNGELVKALAMCHSLTRIDGKLNGDPLDLILFNQTNWSMVEGPDESQASESNDDEHEFGMKEDSDEETAETQNYDNVQPSLMRPPAGYNFDAKEYAILRQFTFSSSLQRQSVIVAVPDAGSHDYFLYSKGSPEMIQTLCRPETLPSDYMEVVNEYAQHGYRLIAVACRKLDMSYLKVCKVPRAEIETDMELLGLVVLENRVKPQTLGVINQLNRAKIRTVMVTGDNLLTGLSVARECGIIRPDKKAFLLEHNPDKKDDLGRTLLTIKQSVSSSEDIVDEGSFVTVEMRRMIDSSYQMAISGTTFAVITHEYPELLPKLVCVCDVFARMAPDQKKQLVNTLQDVEYTVAMCGDGANDCAALKAAHAGISLSEAEASIAAPFTSKIADISCVPEIIREGRAALVTSFGIFKYMAGYSLTQFITIMQLYWLSTNLTDMQFLYIDLFLITTAAFVFGNTPACEHLASTPPPTRLLSIGSISSILGQLVIIAISQVSMFIWTTFQPWFSPYTVPLGGEGQDKKCMQGTVIFGISVFQYVALSIIYSKGAPYRQTIFHNKPFVLLIAVLVVVNIWIVLFPPYFIIDFLEYDPIPYFEYRLIMIMVSLVSIFVMFGFETLIVDVLLHDKREKLRKKRLVKKELTTARSMNEAIREYQRQQPPSNQSPPVKPIHSWKSWLQSRKLRGEDAVGAQYERTLVAIGAEPVWIRSIARYLPADPLRPTASFQNLRGVKANGQFVDIVDEMSPHKNAWSSDDE